MNFSNSIFKSLKQDLPAGAVVFLVALPLCLGISLASGASFFSGIIAGVVGGLVIGSFSSSQLSVSGPAAGLAALVFAAIHNIGSFPLFLCAVVIAGLLQILMGSLKMGAIASYFPNSVIKGLLTSIGILIIAKQIPHAVGYDKGEKGILSEFLVFDEDWHYFFKPLHHIDVGVLMICFVSLAIMIIWERPFIKRKVALLPGALVAVVVSVLLSELLGASNSLFKIEEEHLVNIPEAKNIASFFQFFILPDFGGFTQNKVIVTGAMIALIASLETLLSIEAVDNMDPARNVTNANKELIAQGIGNTISGLIGGLPITSVIVRSSANIYAGAKTKKATIFHGCLLLFCVILMPKMLNKIPLSALAAILLMTGYKLCRFSVFAQMIRKGRTQYIPFFVTIIVILSIDLIGLIPTLKGEGLLVGVIAGFVVAAISLLQENSKNAYHFEQKDLMSGTKFHFGLSEEVSFLNKATIRTTLDKLPHSSIVEIDASRTKYIDIDVIEIIKEFRDVKAPLKNIQCSTINFKESYQIEASFSLSASH